MIKIISLNTPYSKTFIYIYRDVHFHYIVIVHYIDRDIGIDIDFHDVL